ncbi:ATP-binding protein [Plebeiibacterium marinum]|uniref:histidine kinase n=1 Tax=Plebeiibacterium marinum TaxID=2992111 RepID=A0AAE3SJZ3_9BACT|nr:tetratricopeptide repeat-containing sensor histidine kinase [Plebeiobacterium marinum]MCW3806019.1 tetratricopeptide repeat-containing sensor histidine kinase [Plebeiobacterium marinum]
MIVAMSSGICAEELVADSLRALYKNKLSTEDDSLLYELCHQISYTSKTPDVKLKYSNLAYAHALSYGGKTQQAAAKFLSVAPYLKKMELDSAINALFVAEGIYRECDKMQGVASCYVGLADIYKRNNEIDKAELYYKKSIHILKEFELGSRIAATYMNLGELYRKTERYSLAVEYLKKSDSIYRGLKNECYSSYCIGNIGLVYTAQNKLDSAEIFLYNSIGVLEPLGDNYAVSSYLDGLAEVYFKRKQCGKAEQTSLKSLRLAQDYKLKEQVRDASLRLSTIYNQSKEYDKAFFYHKQYVAYRDSINNEEIIRKIANLRTKYEVARKQAEVDEEKEQKERYLIVAIAAVSVLIVLSVLVFIVLKISRYRKKVNQKLNEQRQELANANATKNKFFSILSHDLRSPLATFHSYSEVMDLCANHEDLDKLKEISREMKSSSANMLDLLDNLLQWGVNQMGTKKSVPANVSLRDVVLMEVRHLQHVSDKKKIEVCYSIEKDTTLFVDRVKLAMTIRNLLNNAIKFTPSGGKVTLSSHHEGARTILKISDTGVGMTPEQRDQLFDFSKINSTYGTQNEKGVGLGMQLVCEFVKQSKASIKVESELGVGTTFILLFEDQGGEGACG